MIGWRTRRTGVRAKPDGFNPTKFTCPIVYSFASGGGDQPSAEEITQEVFLDLWQNPEKFDAQHGTLRSFLLARTHGKSSGGVLQPTTTPVVQGVVTA